MLTVSRDIYYRGERAKLFDYTLSLFQNYKLQANFILSQLESKKIFKTSLNVLELGCGTGSLLRTLAQRERDSLNLIGVDISEEMIKIARQKCKSEKIEWIVQDAPQFLKETKKTFDCIFFLFNFVQGFQNLKKIDSFFSLLSKRVTHDGIIIFDWHNEPVFYKKHPASIKTRLDLSYKGNGDKTICYIYSKYKGINKIICCHFEVNLPGKKDIHLITKHKLTTLTSKNVASILESNGLIKIFEASDYTNTRYDEKVHERCITVARSLRYSEHIESLIKQRLKEAQISPLYVSTIGSFRNIAIQPKEGDIDMLMIFPSVLLQNKNTFYKIKSTLAKLCDEQNIQKCEFRHGPFKEAQKLQIHALIHTEITILKVPIITRWVWSLHVRNEIPQKMLTPRFPTKHSLLVSCKREVSNLFRQCTESRILYRYWLFGNKIKLCVTKEELTTNEMVQNAFRYFILAAATDTAAVWNIDLNIIDWFSKRFSSKICSILRKVTEDRKYIITYEDVKLFLKSILTFLGKN